MRKRENGLDLVRILAAFLVVAVHVCTVQRKAALASDVIDFNYHFFAGMRHLGQSAVIVFIMLSGAFVLKAKSTADYKSFYKKSWGKIVVPTIIFSIFYLFFEWFIYYKTGVFDGYLEGNVAFNSFFIQLVLALEGLPAEHMWYMYALVGIYVLAPFVAMAKEKMSERDFTIACIVMCVWGVVDALTQPQILNWGIGFVSRLLGIFMMGYVVHEWALKKSGNGLAITLILCGLTVNVIEYIVHVIIRNNTKLDEILTPTRPYNAVLVVASMLFIAGFTILDIKADLFYPSALTYWVYLVHPAVMMLLFILESAIFKVPYLEIGIKNPIASGMANTVVVFILSFIIAHFIEKFTSGRAKKVKA